MDPSHDPDINSACPFCAGIGSSFVLAKIAADMRKPFDQYRVTDIETFLHDLPIRKVREVPVNARIWARMAIIRVQSCHLTEFDL
jgi:nucleotidyltransferase/DNA polymerase involved in DNA repair